MIHRKFKQWGWYKNSVVKDIFIELLLDANYTEGIFEGIKIQRGQLVTSYAHLADATGLSLQNVRTAIKRLKSTGEITYKSTSKYSLVTIVNYDLYQSIGYFSTSNLTSNLTSNQQATNNNIKKKINKEYKKDTTQFLKINIDDLETLYET